VYLVCRKPIAYKYGLYGFRLANVEEQRELRDRGMEVSPSGNECVMVSAAAA
jgi:hypothetical protein